jgi:predicted GNAT family acetyltransferase
VEGEVRVMLDGVMTGEVVLQVKEMPYGFDITAMIDGYKVGHIDCRFGEVAMGTKSTGRRVESFERIMMLTYTEVSSAHRRRGISTKMRQKAGELACAMGRQLASDCIRSGFEEAFWDKQLRKGTIVYALSPRDGTVLSVQEVEHFKGLGMYEYDEDDGPDMYEQIERDEIYVFPCPTPDFS